MNNRESTTENNDTETPISQSTASKLRTQSVRGATLVSGSRILILAMRIGSTGVLARLLSPSDYGLVAMTSLIIGFFDVFSDAGLSSATIQKKEITHEQVSTLFWINITLGTLLTVILSASAPAVAWFYNKEELRDITVALSLSFVIGALSVQHQALLRREMRFGPLAVAEIASTVCGIGVAITMAYQDYGYWSLVGLTLSTATSRTLLIWTISRWRPGLPKRNSGVTRMLKFGSDVLLFNVVNFLTRNSDNLLIGKYCGASDLGFYEKAYSLLLLPISQINGPLGAVGTPALSRLQNNPKQFQEYFLTVIRMIASLTIPAILILSIFSDQVVTFWLGKGWEKSAVLFKLLTIGAIVGAISNPLGWLLVALGKTKKYRTMGLTSSTLVVAAFIVGIPYGAEGVAIAYSGAAIALFLPIWSYAINDTPVNLRESLRALLPSTAAGIIAGIPSYYLASKNPLELGEFHLFAVGSLTFGILYALVLFIIFNEAPLFIRTLKELLPKKENLKK